MLFWRHPALIAVLAFAVVAFLLGASGVAADTVTYQYDDLGRLTRITYDDGTTVTYTYDAAGNRSTLVINVPTPVGGPTNTLTPTPTQTSTSTPTSTPAPTPTATPTSTTGPVLLVGDQTIEPIVDTNPAGNAQAFQYTAAASGTANQLFVYLDVASTATQVVVGLYDNTITNGPGTLLTSGTLTTPVAGGWNAVTVLPTGVSGGTVYWIAVLNPPGTGVIQFRDTTLPSGAAETSSETTLTALPASWTRGVSYATGPMSAYASP